MTMNPSSITVKNKKKDLKDIQIGQFFGHFIIKKCKSYIQAVFKSNEIKKIT